jgi:hypothetical protein
MLRRNPDGESAMRDRKKGIEKPEIMKLPRDLAVCILIAVVFALPACKQKEVPGVYVEISLKNDTDIDKYVVFNPNIKTIDECEASFAASLPGVMAKLPEAIPKNSTATGWKCSLKDPSKKK